MGFSGLRSTLGFPDIGFAQNSLVGFGRHQERDDVVPFRLPDVRGLEISAVGVLQFRTHVSQ